MLVDGRRPQGQRREKWIGQARWAAGQAHCLVTAATSAGRGLEPALWELTGRLSCSLCVALSGACAERAGGGACTRCGELVEAGGIARWTWLVDLAGAADDAASAALVAGRRDRTGR